MKVSNEKIISIDISSNSIKIALVSSNLQIEYSIREYLKIINEDIDGFAKRFDMIDLWDKIKKMIKDVLLKHTPNNAKIIAVSTCAQRIATVFLDKSGEPIYGGPNTDVRGIDSAYLIDEVFSEEELFKMTAHNPPLLFCLARLLWFREEEEEKYKKIHKVLMLDDWLDYELTGIFSTDLTSLAESQLIDIKKRTWSKEIIEEFNLDPNLFPPIKGSGSRIGFLKSDLNQLFNLKGTNIPIIKTGADTQASLLGMGAIEKADLGISLGTTAPLHLILDEPYIDPELNFWTSYHLVPDKWIIEQHAGNTGASYSWFKTSFLNFFSDDPDTLVDKFLKNSEPGALSTYAYLGPELMNIKNQTSLKRGVMVFPPPMMISNELPKLREFTRAMIENIGFGIYENYKALQKFQISRVFCAGGMSNSKEILKVIANILGTNLIVPQYKDASFIGAAITVLKALDYYKSYKSIINENIKFENIPNDASLLDKYKQIYLQWKSIKNKIDTL
ncbi:MAG: FGGY-family carbohydrate kinase [Candidatus Lokiarchaeota archaeon]|jgi:sugar (pentulose or hexulose) kinase